MTLLQSFFRVPVAIFRAKTKFHASLRPNEQPIIPPGQRCYPRTDKRWLKASSATNKIVTMNLLQSFPKMPMTLFRAKPKSYASLRSNEEPIIPPGKTYYPRADEQWLKASSTLAFGLSLLPNGEKMRNFRSLFFRVSEDNGASRYALRCSIGHMSRE